MDGIHGELRELNGWHGVTILFSLHDQIPSGKNQIQLCVRRGRIHKYPNNRFVEWREKALVEISIQKMAWSKEMKSTLPLTGDLSMHVKYAARDKRTRDISGMVDALFHLIVLAGLIEDDGQIKRLTWGPVKYKTNCIELEITGD